MNFSFINDIINFFKDNYSDQILNLIIFFIGLFIGILLFLLTFLIVFLISKNKNLLLEKQEALPINYEYKEIINKKINYYKNEFVNAELKDKAIGVIHIGLDMLESISMLYYPNSKDPIFELSIEQLVDLLEYLVKRLDFSINRVLEEKIPFINENSKNKIKEKKLSAVFEIINKKKPIEEQNKNGLFSKIKKSFLKKSFNFASRITKNTINNEVIQLINDFGEDINLVYSKQELQFKQLSKKQLKEIKKKRIGSGKYD